MLVCKETAQYQGNKPEDWWAGWFEGRWEGRREEARRETIRLLKIRFDPDTELVKALTKQLQDVTDIVLLGDLLVEAALAKNLYVFCSFMAAMLILTGGSCDWLERKNADNTDIGSEDASA